MLISPPFILTRAANDTDEEYVSRCMPDSSLQSAHTKSPEGCFPVSFMLGWHGGMHIEAPMGSNNSIEPVRAIADGHIVFVRSPKKKNDISAKDEPLNYNPFGDSLAWTDNGCVIIRHESEFGSTEQTRQSVEYYSIYMHLSELSGEAKQIASGTLAIPRAIDRKDKIGKAGCVYGRERQLHFEIICDDTSLEKLIGRRTGQFRADTPGRTDIMFGQSYFRLPAGTNIYAERPAPNTPSPDAQPIHELSGPMIVGLRYANGGGPVASRGSAYLTSYDEAQGEALGASVEVTNGEYNLYNLAEEIANAYPEATRPQVHVLYELLRYGRVIGPTALDPVDVPHWRQVRYEQNRLGWVNLNAENVLKHSDADFPDWQGWRLVDDDTDADSRCESSTIFQIIEDTTQADGRLTREKLQSQLGVEAVSKRLQRVICKVPTEWDTSTAQARWDWLKTDPDFSLSDEDFKSVIRHIEALAINWSNITPVGNSQNLPNVHWHFNPKIFIQHFRTPSIWQDLVRRWERARATHTLPEETNLGKLGKATLYEHGLRNSKGATKNHLNVDSFDSFRALDQSFVTQNRRAVIFGMRIPTDINANQGRGLWDDRVTILKRDDSGLLEYLYSGPYTTEPSGRYLARGQHLDAVNHPLGDGKNVGGTADLDIGRLISNRTYEYAPHNHTAFNRFGQYRFGTLEHPNQFNILRKTEASYVERLVSNANTLPTGQYISGNNATWQTGVTTGYSEERTMHFHKGYNGLTGSSGCQTFPVTAGQSFENFMNTLEPMDTNSRFQYILILL